MKPTTASNVAVSLAGALAETVAEYEARVSQLQQNVEAMGHQLKQAAEDRSKVVAILGKVRESLDLCDQNTIAQGVCDGRIRNALDDSPWPIPNSHLVRRPPG